MKLETYFKPRKTLRSTIIILVTLFLLAPSVQGRGRLYLFGAGNFYLRSGSEADYIEGTNDFPITAAHQNFGLGFGIIYDPGLIYFGFESQYTLAGRATLHDPSDNDRVTIDTYPHAEARLILGCNLVNTPSWRLFLQGGVGLSQILNAETRIYTSELGFETRVEPPEKKRTVTTMGGGLGLEYYFSGHFGAYLAGLVQYFDLDKPETSFQGLFGLTFKF
ncbi:hypothetical protein NLC35_03365 [Candidatus Aminicenantes bacterium AC-334-K16]|jgi:hypothetical protein|nr:hypothetical protein [Candidatus Aminicenantes bacterium AC-334-K16]